MNSTAFEEACMEGDLETVKRYIEAGFNSKPYIECGFDIACENGYLEMVQYLYTNAGTGDLEPGTGPNLKSPEFLYSAVEGKNLEVLKFLINNGVEIVDREDDVELYIHSCICGNLPIFRYLVEECKLEIDWDSAFEMAVWTGKLGMVKYICQNWHNPTQEDLDISVFRAAEDGHLKVLKYLVELGANPSKYNLVSLAAKNGHLKVIKYLKKIRADFKDRERVIEMCIDRGYPELVQFLERWDE